jgi:hypothetical protein
MISGYGARKRCPDRQLHRCFRFVYIALPVRTMVSEACCVELGEPGQLGRGAEGHGAPDQHGAPWLGGGRGSLARLVSAERHGVAQTGMGEEPRRRGGGSAGRACAG